MTEITSVFDPDEGRDCPECGIRICGINKDGTPFEMAGPLHTPDRCICVRNIKAGLRKNPFYEAIDKLVAKELRRGQAIDNLFSHIKVNMSKDPFYMSDQQLADAVQDMLDYNQSA